MIGNIIDNRTDHYVIEVDAVFEPSFHDRTRADGGRTLPDVSDQPDYFIVDAKYATTVRDAVQFADSAWSFPVTIYLYDRGSAPLG